MPTCARPWAWPPGVARNNSAGSRPRRRSRQYARVWPKRLHQRPLRDPRRRRPVKACRAAWSQRTQRRIVEGPLQTSSDRPYVKWIDERAGVADDLRQRAAIACDQRRAARQRLERGHAEPLVQADDGDATGATVQRRQVLIGDVRQATHALVEACVDD